MPVDRVALQLLTRVNDFQDMCCEDIPLGATAPYSVCTRRFLSKRVTTHGGANLLVAAMAT
jgi:hypothetical protein